MSDLENNLAAAMWLLVGLGLLWIFGPWLVLAGAGWLLEPRTGSWHGIQNWIGGAWAAGWLGVYLWGRFHT